MTWGRWSFTFVVGVVSAALAFVLFEGRGVAQEGEGGRAAPQRAGRDPLPGTKLSVEQLRAQVFHVSSGRRFRPKSWPTGARVAVSLAFDANATAGLAAGNTTLNSLSQSEYGALDGLPRLLRLLDKHKVPATFFVPAVSAIMYPKMISSILEGKRHEIGLHGWVHEDLALLSEAEERRLLNQAIDYLTKATGKRPLGVVAPGANTSDNTFKLAKEAGLVYIKSYGSDDPYEILLDGQPSGLIGVPGAWALNDSTYFGRNGGMPSPELVFKVWKDEFDLAYEEGGLLAVTMHPPEMGRRAAAVQLDKFLTYVQSKPGVWFGTAEEIVNYCKKNATPSN